MRLVLLERLWGSLASSWEALGASWERLRGILGHLGSFLAASWGLLAAKKPSDHPKNKTKADRPPTLQRN